MWNHLPRMTERMRQLGIARPLLTPGQAGDLLAFLFTVDYFDAPGNVQEGRRLFTEKRCIACHQVAGTGGVVGPSLDFLGQHGSPIFVAATMWNHGPAMTEAMRARGIQRPRFEGAELTNLIAYLRSVSPQRADEPLYLFPGRADEGHRLFLEKRCAQCHSVNGQGGRLAPDLGRVGRDWSLMRLAAAMWNKAPAMTEMMKARDIAIPQLRPSDVADLVAYLYSVRYLALPGDARRAPAILAAKGCLACHSLRGQGGKTARDLLAAKRLDSPAAVIAAMWNHAFAAERPGAPASAWPELRAEDLADLVAFLGLQPGTR
jgi:mono/diheme cytochrome c family protein